MEELGLRVEGEAEAALTLDETPPPADERGALPVAGAEELEYAGKAFIWKI